MAGGVVNTKCGIIFFFHHPLAFIHISFSGHIGMTFQGKKPVPGVDPFSMKHFSEGPRPLSGLDPSDEEYANSKWCYDTPGVVHPDQVKAQAHTYEKKLSKVDTKC